MSGKHFNRFEEIIDEIKVDSTFSNLKRSRLGNMKRV